MLLVNHGGGSLGNLSSFRAILFVLLTGISCTFYNYYFFGASQIDMFPIIYREIDASFLLNDWYTNISTGYNEDFLFAKFITLLSRFFSLPLIFFSLTLLSNIGIALAAFLSAKDFSGSNKVAGMLAGILAVCMPTFILGIKDIFIRANLTPEHLIMPLVLIAIWKGIRQQPIITGLFAGLATFIHPLTGPGVGGLMLLQIMITQLYFKSFNRKTFVSLLFGGILILIPLLFHLVPYVQSFDVRISDEYFIEIMKMRFPHHYLPSYFFMAERTVIGIVFLIASAVAWNYWRKEQSVEKTMAFSFIIITLLLFVLCFVGWLFSEVWPSRLMFTLQPFRFLIIIKFLGIVLISIYLGNKIAKTDRLASKVSYLLAAFYPPVFLVQYFTKNIRPIGLISISLIVFCATAFWYPNHTIKLFTVLVFFFLLLVYYQKVFKWGAICFLFFIILNNVYFSQQNYKNKLFRKLSSEFIISYDNGDVNKNVKELSDFIEENTTKDSKLLVGPRDGALRVLANRALVIDAYGMPMNDLGIKEWMQRVNQVYNRGNSRALQHIRETSRNYNRLSDIDLQELKEQYGCNYAVFNTNYKTQLPVVFENSGFKLIEL